MYCSLSAMARPEGRRGLSRLAVVLGLIAAGSIGDARAAEPVTLTLYSAQHPQMIDRLVEGFEKQSGIKIAVRRGEAPEIANQIAEEGAASPADLYITENSPELLLLEEKGLLAKVDPATLKAVPAQYSSPTGAWVGFLGRENVLEYNTSLIRPEALPASLMALAKPEWKGKLAFAPTDADFLPLISAVRVLRGEAAALAWLQGLKANGQVYDDDEGVVAAVDRGSAAVGIINSYYWERYRVETGDAKIKSAIHHFGGGDPGGLINVSGAAVLKSSHAPDAAQAFLRYIVSAEVQAELAMSDVDFEYPLTAGVAANPALKPFATLEPPAIDITTLGDDRGAAQILRDAGLL